MAQSLGSWIVGVEFGAGVGGGLRFNPSLLLMNAPHPNINAPNIVPEYWENARCSGLGSS